MERNQEMKNKSGEECLICCLEEPEDIQSGHKESPPNEICLFMAGV